MWLRPAFVAALVMTALACAPAAFAGESAGWQAFRAKNYDRAERLWQREAENGDPNGLFGLGVLAEHRGDETAASGWYEKAARAGLASAQVLIAQRYISGTGVTADTIAAYAWLTRAIDSGVPNAAKMRDQLAKSMTPESVQQAETVAATLKDK